MPSDSQPVTEEMVEAAMKVYYERPVMGITEEQMRIQWREALEAAQAVAPPKVSEDGMMAGECCMMAHDRCAAILDDMGAPQGWERGLAAMFLPEAISNVHILSHWAGFAEGRASSPVAPPKAPFPTDAVAVLLRVSQVVSLTGNFGARAGDGEKLLQIAEVIEASPAAPATPLLTADERGCIEAYIYDCKSGAGYKYDYEYDVRPEPTIYLWKVLEKLASGAAPATEEPSSGKSGEALR